MYTVNCILIAHLPHTLGLARETAASWVGVRYTYTVYVAFLRFAIAIALSLGSGFGRVWNKPPREAVSLDTTTLLVLGTILVRRAIKVGAVPSPLQPFEWQVTASAIGLH